MEREELEQISEELEELLKTSPLAKEVKAASLDTDRRTERKTEELNQRMPAGPEISEEEFLEDIPLEEEVEELEIEDQDTDDEEMFVTREPKEYTTWIRPSDGLVAAFLVPIVIMIIIFAQRGIFPFGEESFLRTDMYHQYAPFFSEFRDKLTQGGSLLYSWDIGMGVNFAALYAYYLASPLNWLLILCPRSMILEFMTYSIVLKIGLSGLSFAYYLKKHCRTQDFGVAFFGIFYALSGYMAAYSWNIMWLDCIILFPLVMLGLERLVKEKKCFLYCITLGLCIMSNYYISIMICLFMVIYFVALLILEKKKPAGEYGKNIFQFAFYSLIAGGLAAAVLIPEVYALQSTASGDFNFPKTYDSYFPIFDMLARHIGNVEIEIGLDHWPNIYCGVAVFIFFLLYLANRKIAVKEKAVYCGLLLIFFASFSINVLNFIWHGFHYPNSLPCRQSFIYIALMLLMCYRAYTYLKETPWKNVVIAFWGAVIFVLLAEKLVTQTHFHFIVYYVAILFLAMYAGLMYLYKKKNLNPNLLILLALSLVAVEAAINTTVTSVTTTSRTSYIRDNSSVERLAESLEPNPDFYRIEKVTRKTKNDGAWMNFPSVSLFSSTANADLSQFFKRIGCESSTNAYSITGSTPLIDSLFAVRYGIYSSQQEESDILQFKAQDGDTFLYQNLYTLPAGFLVPYDFENNWQIDLNNPADVQNDLSTIIGAEPVLIGVDGVTDNKEFTFTPEVRGQYYVYITNKKVEKVTATVGENTKTFDNVNRGYLVELGVCEAGEEVVIKTEEDQSLNAVAYQFSNEGLISVYNHLNQSPLQLTSWKDTSMAGTIEAAHAGMLFTSIPYDKGWSVWLDGEPVETRKIMDTFLTLDVPEGSHTLEFKYVPEGLKMGLMISGSCAAFLIIFAGSQFLIGSYNKKQNSKRRRVRRDTL